MIQRTAASCRDAACPSTARGSRLASASASTSLCAMLSASPRLHAPTPFRVARCVLERRTGCGVTWQCIAGSPTLELSTAGTLADP